MTWCKMLVPSPTNKAYVRERLYSNREFQDTPLFAFLVIRGSYLGHRCAGTRSTLRDLYGGFVYLFAFG